ncbi:MAG: hypothetical protein HY904_06530 [Deltaproteobacteria bacterium]|nr:hypothetical protein [Deltaproteobacteria bacterium]
MRRALVGLSLVGGLAAWGTGCPSTPCITSSQCGEGATCVSGSCQDTLDPVTGNTSSGGRDAGASSSGGTDGGADGGSSSGDGGTSGDASPFSISLTQAPTGVAFDETFTQLVVASGGGVGTMHVDTFSLPYTGAAPIAVDLGASQGNCTNRDLVLRNGFLIAGCSVSPSAVRVFSSSTGALVAGAFAMGTAGVVGDHTDMALVVAAFGTGGQAFTFPTAGIITPIQPPNAQDQNNGMGLIESGSPSKVTAAVAVSPTPSELRYLTFAGNTFTLQGQLPYVGFPNPELIVSGRPTVGASPALQPVVVLDGSQRTAAVFHGPDLTAAANGAQLAARRTLLSLDLPAGLGAIRAKIDRRGKYVYYFNVGAAKLCRFGTTAALGDQLCVDIPTGCGPTDFAPGSSVAPLAPTVVACGSSPFRVVAWPAF